MKQMNLIRAKVTEFSIEKIVRYCVGRLGKYGYRIKQNYHILLNP